MAESDTWEERENLENAKEVIEEYKKEYQQDIEKVNRQEKEERTFRREELPGRFTAKKLFGWSDKRYDKEYWGRLEQNWKQWKGRRRRQILETIEEEKEIKQKKPEIKE